MPTLAALAGLAAPADVDGVDISTTLLGTEQPDLAKRFLYWEWNKNGLRVQAARRGPWKAIRDPHSRSMELYNLSTDIGEKHNLAAEHPEIVAEFGEYFATARNESPQWPVTVTGPLPGGNAHAGE